jgi:hypothetical protein
MTIEQTTQLIQLTLNSVLMLGACGVMLCAALMHQVILENRSALLAQGASRSGLATLGKAADRSRRSRHQLHLQQRRTRRAVFWMNGACWLLGGSCGALVLRSVWELNFLIPLSLGLFAIACGLFLIGTGSLLLSLMSTSTTPAEPSQILAKVVEFKARSRKRRSF